ncbi:hypothetical protein [Mycolicibacterium sp. XJ775]
MTAPMLGEDAPDAEDFTACWLQPLLRAAVERKTDDVLPFATIQRVAGDDDPDCGTDDPVVQVDILGLGVVAAKTAANEVHRRMLLLFRDCSDVIMSDGRTANLDFGRTLMKPVRMPYGDDKIVRYVGRYHLALSYVTVA